MALIILLGKWAFIIRVWRFSYETNARYIFVLYFNSWGVKVWRTDLAKVSKVESLMWKIKLPFVYLTNASYQKTILTSDSLYLRVPVWTGRLFGKKIGVFR